VVAQINLHFNQDLQAGRRDRVDTHTTPEELTERLGRTMQQAMTEDGPFDDPTYCYAYGYALARDNGFYRQAVVPMERVRELDPDFLPARMWLAQIYAFNHLTHRALEVLQAPLAQPEIFSINNSNSMQFSMLAADVYFQNHDAARADRVLQTEVSRNPTNGVLLVRAEQLYASNGHFTNALAIADQALRLTPDDPNWLFTKGYICIQLEKNDDAIAALTRALAIQKSSDDALFNRGIAYLGAGNLEAAQADFLKLQQKFTNSYRIAYNLGDIAWRKHDTNEAIRNYRIYLANAPTNIYLANAPTNTSEASVIKERLRQLQP
jgi:tetratricopeptide (TPR) repeat protein